MKILFLTFIILFKKIFWNLVEHSASALLSTFGLKITKEDSFCHCWGKESPILKGHYQATSKFFWPENGILLSFLKGKPLFEMCYFHGQLFWQCPYRPNKFQKGACLSVRRCRVGWGGKYTVMQAILYFALGITPRTAGDSTILRTIVRQKLKTFPLPLYWCSTS